MPDNATLQPLSYIFVLTVVVECDLYVCPQVTRTTLRS